MAGLRQVHGELLEVLELYCETLTARFALLSGGTEEPAEPLRDAVAGLVYAAPKTAVPELDTLHALFGMQYAPAWMEAAKRNADGMVPTRITSKLAFGTPSDALVDAYLDESRSVANQFARRIMYRGTPA